MAGKKELQKIEDDIEKALMAYEKDDEDRKSLTHTKKRKER